MTQALACWEIVEVPQNTATKFIANLDQTDPKLIEFWKNYIRKATKKKKK